MKSGILTLLLLTAFGLSSCSDDIHVSESEDGQDIMLTVDFQTDGLKLKADDTETIVENRFVAAFRDNECTGIAYDDNNSTLTIKAKTGNVIFIAIANANETAGLAGVIENYKKNHILPGYDALKAFESKFGTI